MDGDLFIGLRGGGQNEYEESTKGGAFDSHVRGLSFI